MSYTEIEYPLQKETYKIIGICMEIHKLIGKGFLEIVYKDAFHYELISNKIPFEREKEYLVNYKGIILPHKFYADFVVYDKIIVEIKAQKGLAEDQYFQVLNYLAVSKCQVGLLINFGESSLQTKRIIL